MEYDENEYVDYELVAETTSSVVNPTPYGAIKAIVSKGLETVQFCEAQKTEREKIKAHSKEVIAQINAQKEFLMQYLDKTFDDRKLQFDSYFKALDKAIEANNPQMMAMCLQNINNLALSSPFRPLLEAQQHYKELASGKGKLDF